MRPKQEHTKLIWIITIFSKIPFTRLIRTSELKTDVAFYQDETCALFRLDEFSIWNLDQNPHIHIHLVSNSL